MAETNGSGAAGEPAEEVDNTEQAQAIAAESQHANTNPPPPDVHQDDDGGERDEPSDTSGNSGMLEEVYDMGYSDFKFLMGNRATANPNLADMDRIRKAAADGGLQTSSGFTRGRVVAGTPLQLGPKLLPGGELTVMLDALQPSLTRTFWGGDGEKAHHNAQQSAALYNLVALNQHGVGTNFGWTGSAILSCGAGFESCPDREFIELVPLSFGLELLNRAQDWSVTWSKRESYYHAKYYPIDGQILAGKGLDCVIAYCWAFSGFGQKKIRLYTGGASFRELLPWVINRYDDPSFWGGDDDYATQLYRRAFVHWEKGHFSKKDRDDPNSASPYDGGANPLNDDGEREGGPAEMDGSSENSMDAGQSDPEANATGDEAAGGKSKRVGKKGVVARRKASGMAFKRRILTPREASAKAADILGRLNRMMVERVNSMAMEQWQEGAMSAWRVWVSRFKAAGVVTAAEHGWGAACMLRRDPEHDDFGLSHPLAGVWLTPLRVGSQARIVIGNISPVSEYYIGRGVLTPDGDPISALGREDPLIGRRADAMDTILMYYVSIASEIDCFLATATATSEYTRCWWGVSCGSHEEASRYMVDQEDYATLIMPLVLNKLPYGYELKYEDMASECDVEWIDFEAMCCPERIEPCLYSFLHNGRKYASFADPPALRSILLRNCTEYTTMAGLWTDIGNEVHEVTRLSTEDPVYLTAHGDQQRYVSDVIVKFNPHEAATMHAERNTVGLFRAPDDSRLKRRTVGTVPIMMRFACTDQELELFVRASADDDPNGRGGIHQVFNGGALRAHKPDSSALLGRTGRFAVRRPRNVTSGSGSQ